MADDFGSTVALSGSVVDGGFVTGTIETGSDIDAFRVSLVSGQIYLIDLEGQQTGKGSLGDPELSVFLPNGGFSAINDDIAANTQLNSRLIYRASTTGTYLLLAQSADSGTGTYRLSVSSLSSTNDDLPNDGNTSGLVTVGGFSSGTFETAGDSDAFRVTLVGGVAYQFDVEGSATGRGSLGDPKLTVYNSGDAVVASDDNSGAGANAQLVFTAPSSGSYFLSISSPVNGVGTYRVSAVARTAADDFGLTPQTAGSVVVGSFSTGAVETSGDADGFAVNLVSGIRYRFDLEGADTGSGTLADPTMELYAPNAATQLASDEDTGTGRNAQITFTPNSSGTYFLVAYASTEAGTGSYRLSASVMPTAPASVNLTSAYTNIMRASPTGADVSFLANLTSQANIGAISLNDALTQIALRAKDTTSVATLGYEFFTGKIPTLGGIDYLVSPTGPNPNNINSAYYQSFNLENRYINFAMNLGKVGAGAVNFLANFGNKTLIDTVKIAYTTIFGSTPTDAKVHALTDSRIDYFAYYGQDGANGIGTKAAAVGWLLAEAVKADIGIYAKSNDAFLVDLADGANFEVDIIGVYGRPEFVFLG